MEFMSRNKSHKTYILEDSIDNESNKKYIPFTIDDNNDKDDSFNEFHCSIYRCNKITILNYLINKYSFIRLQC